MNIRQLIKICFYAENMARVLLILSVTEPDRAVGVPVVT